MTAIEFKKLVAVYNSTPCGVGGVVVRVQIKKWIMKSFSSWPFLCLYVLCDKAHAFCLREPQSRRAVFSSYSTRESFAGKCRFSETVAYPSQMLSDFFPDINLRAIDTVFKIITDLLRLRYGLFLSPSTLSEGKNDFCCRLIDRLNCVS